MGICVTVGKVFETVETMGDDKEVKESKNDVNNDPQDEDGTKSSPVWSGKVIYELKEYAHMWVAYHDDKETDDI